MRKKLFVYALIVIFTIFGVYFLGTKVIGVIGMVLVALGLKRANNGLDEAKKRIQKAGEGFEAKKHDPDSALDFFDDFFSRPGK
mgnify:FL=1|jgi:Na+/H+-translocating membrane pyrophosphatase